MKSVFFGMLLALVCFVSCEETPGAAGVTKSKVSADTVSDAYIKGLLQTLESSECVWTQSGIYRRRKHYF